MPVSIRHGPVEDLAIWLDKRFRVPKNIEKRFYNQRDTYLLIDKWICVFQKWNLFQSFYKLNPIYPDIFEILSTNETSMDPRRTQKDTRTRGSLE